MKFDGWAYIERIVPWKHIFSVSIDECKFTGYMDKVLMQCDIEDGYINYALKNVHPRCGIEDTINRTFALCDFNVREDYECESDYDAVNDQIVPSDRSHFVFPDFDKRNLAQVTVIDNRYVYFNCSSYGFWSSNHIVDAYICTKLDSNNLGGFLIDINMHPIIKNVLGGIV